MGKDGAKRENIMNTQQRRSEQRKKNPSTKGIAAISSKVHKSFCPLCSVPMDYSDAEKVWNCPRCGHQAYPKLSQITLSKSELKASNDFYHNKTKVFFGSSPANRTHRRITAYPLKSIHVGQSKVFQNLAEAEEATNIPHNYDSA